MKKKYTSLKVIKEKAIEEHNAWGEEFPYDTKEALIIMLNQLVKQQYIITTKYSIQGKVIVTM